MLAIDWIGCLLSASVLGLLLRGQNRLLRTGLALLLGELGRVLTLLLLGGDLVALTAGGAFTRMEVAGAPALVVQVGGLLAGAVLGLLLGRQVATDTMLYAVLAGGFTLFVLN